MSPVLAVPNIATDPGFLFSAALGTALPLNTVAGSVFTDDWSTAAGWTLLGPTEEGHNFDFATTTEPIEVAEFLDPIRYVETGRTGSIAFALVNLTVANIKRALNGGTTTPTGTGATLLTKYAPPKLGQSTRLMIGWESQDATERLVAYQCFNTGTVSIARRKGAAKATLPVEYSLEVPAGGDPFHVWSAGVARAGV